MLGDQPLIGADLNGFYVTTNEFPIVGDGFNGAQIYAISKTALETSSSPAVVHLAGGPLAEGISYLGAAGRSPARWVVRIGQWRHGVLHERARVHQHTR